MDAASRAAVVEVADIAPMSMLASQHRNFFHLFDV